MSGQNFTYSNDKGHSIIINVTPEMTQAILRLIASGEKLKETERVPIRDIIGSQPARTAFADAYANLHQATWAANPGVNRALLNDIFNALIKEAATKQCIEKPYLLESKAHR